LTEEKGHEYLAFEALVLPLANLSHFSSYQGCNTRASARLTIDPRLIIDTSK